ncbi:hypothetical protein Xoosp13_20 [Xanthomonas phage Xoo-sp13]|nr:hypothetical protein Xoosp13_20 [Xanthomonas phage Xoo-sp13]
MLTNPHAKTIRDDKGKKGGSCNRTQCQAPNTAFCYNRETQAYYCRPCAHSINAWAKIDKIVPFIDIPENYNELRRAAFLADEAQNAKK